MASELGQQTVDFSTVVNRAAEESFLSLKELTENSKAAAPDLSDTDKKIGLLKYLVKTQQRMLRLNVLAKWCQQVSPSHSFLGFQLGLEIFNLGYLCYELCVCSVRAFLFRVGECKFDFFSVSEFMFRRFLLSDLG